MVNFLLKQFVPTKFSYIPPPLKTKTNVVLTFEHIIDFAECNIWIVVSNANPTIFPDGPFFPNPFSPSGLFPGTYQVCNHFRCPSYVMIRL